MTSQNQPKNAGHVDSQARDKLLADLLSKMPWAECRRCVNRRACTRHGPVDDAGEFFCANFVAELRRENPK